MTTHAHTRDGEEEMYSHERTGERNLGWIINGLLVAICASCVGAVFAFSADIRKDEVMRAGRFATIEAEQKAQRELLSRFEADNKSAHDEIKVLLHSLLGKDGK